MGGIGSGRTALGPGSCSCCGGERLFVPDGRKKAGGSWRCAVALKHKDRSKRLARKAERRARQKGAPQIERFDRQEIWERDGGICRYCNEPCDPRDWHLAHLVALVRGGEHSRANVAVSHPHCNLSDRDGRLSVQLHMELSYAA